MKYENLTITAETTYRILCAHCNSVVEGQSTEKILRDATSEGWVSLRGNNLCNECLANRENMYGKLFHLLTKLEEGECVLDDILDLTPHDFRNYEEFINEYQYSNAMDAQDSSTLITLNTILMRMMIDNRENDQRKIAELKKTPSHHKNVRFNGDPIHNPYIDFNLSEDGGDIHLSVDGYELTVINEKSFSENKYESIFTTIKDL